MWQNQQASNFTIYPALIYLTCVSWGFFSAGRDGSLHPLSSCTSLVLSDKGAENGSVGSAAQSRAIAFRGGTERSSEKECLQPGSGGEPPSSCLRGSLASDFTLSSWDSLLWGADLFSIAGVPVINLTYSQATHLRAFKSTLQIMREHPPFKCLHFEEQSVCS